MPDGVEELLDEGADLLFVWGGDGTVQRAIDAVAGRPVTLAILPAGTANLFATNLGLPKDLEAACGSVCMAPAAALDVGKVNGEHFAVMAGVGLDAMMIRDADAGLKDKVGRLAYVWTGAKNVRLDAVKMTIEVDGKRMVRGQGELRPRRQRRRRARRPLRVPRGVTRRRPARHRRRHGGRLVAVGRTLGRSVLGDVRRIAVRPDHHRPIHRGPPEPAPPVRARRRRPEADEEAEDQGEA